MLKTSEIKEILSKANMPKLKNILTPELIMEKNVIYRYYCKGNGLSYIGKCGDRPVIYRWQEHIGALRNNRHGITPTNPNPDYFQNAWNKYGEDSFTIEVIDVTTGELLNEKERDWISRYNSYHNGFNGTEGGDGLTSELAKKTWSDPKVRAKRVEALKVSNKKTWSDPEIYSRRVEAYKKTWSDPKVRAKRIESAKISAKKTWSNPKIYAKRVEAQNRPEVKQRHSEAMRGKTLSDSHKAKLLAAHKGKSHNVKKSYVRLTKEQCIIIAEQMLKGEFNSFAECARFYNVDSTTISDMFNYKYCRKACRNEIIRLCEQYNYQMKGLEVT